MCLCNYIIGDSKGLKFFFEKTQLTWPEVLIIALEYRGQPKNRRLGFTSIIHRRPRFTSIIPNLTRALVSAP